jgi:hypothetical protein
MMYPGLQCVLLTLLAAPVFGATVQFPNLLPAGTTPTLVKTDASGNVYVAGDYFNLFKTGGFLAEISPDGSKLISFSQIGGYCYGSAQCGPTSLAVGPNSSWFVVSVIEDPIQTIATIYSSNAKQFPGYLSIYDMAVDSQGNLYVTGNDPNVVSTPGSVSGTNQSNNFIAKLNGQGQVIYAIHNYGGSHIAVDAKGNVFTVAADPYGQMPTPGAYQTSIPPEPCNVVTMNGPACNNSQYVTGINSAGDALLFSTYLTSGGGETPAGIAIDAAGNVYVAGATGSPNYPTTADALEPEFQAQEQPFAGYVTNGYVSALSPTGTELIFSAYFGGSDYDTITSMSLDETSDLIYLAGNAASPDLPGIFGIYRNCVPQSFVSALTTDGTAVTRTQTVSPPGGGYPSMAIGANGTAWVAAAYFVQVSLDSPDPPIACLADSAGVFVTSTVTPGQLLTIHGNGLSTDTSSPPPSNGFYQTSGTSASVTVSGIPRSHSLRVASPTQRAGSIRSCGASYGNHTDRERGFPYGASYREFGFYLRDRSRICRMHAHLSGTNGHAGFESGWDGERLRQSSEGRIDDHDLCRWFRSHVACSGNRSDCHERDTLGSGLPTASDPDFRRGSGRIDLRRICAPDSTAW